MDKRGITTGVLLFFVVFTFISLIVIGVWIYGSGAIADGFQELADANITIGEVSFNQTYEDTLKPGLTTVSNSAPKLASTLLLFGMVILMVMNGYFFRQLKGTWILLDFFIIIIAFVLAVVISSSFETFINSSPEFLSIFSTELSLASRFMLNLHVAIPVIGVLIMVATYAITKPKADEGQAFPEDF